MPILMLPSIFAFIGRMSLHAYSSYKTASKVGTISKVVLGASSLLFPKEEEITKGTKKTIDNKEYLEMSISTVDSTLKDVMINGDAWAKDYHNVIAVDKQIVIDKSISDFKITHEESISVVEDSTVVSVNRDVTGASLLDVLKSSANLKTDQSEVIQKTFDAFTTVLQNQNLLIKERNDISLASLLALENQNNHFDHIATVLTDTLVPIAQSSALFPHLIKTINLGNQAHMEALSESSRINAETKDENLAVMEKIEAHEAIKAELAEFNLKGDSSVKTWSGLNVKPAHAKAKKDYELSKTESQLNKITTADIEDSLLDDFNIFQFITNEIRSS